MDRFTRTITETHGEDHRRVLASNPILAHLEEGEREQLLQGGVIRSLAAGRTLFRRGDPASHVLLVLEGSVVVEAGSSGGDRVVVNHLERGELFGEMGVIEGRPRSASVITLEPSTVLWIDQADFLALLVSHPALGIRIASTLTQRLDRLTEVVGGMPARSA